MRNPLEPFMEEIADLILKPKIDRLLHQHASKIRRKGDITSLFNKIYGAAISDWTMDRWLKLAGYQVGHRFIVYPAAGPDGDDKPSPSPPSPPAPMPNLNRPLIQPQHGGLVGNR